MTKDRLHVLWAYQLLRHPLLAAYLKVTSYEDVRFVNDTPQSLAETMDQAASRFAYLGSGSDIVSTYLNGPRTLSNDCLAMLVVAVPETEDGEYEIMLCATHYLGDGMALHTFMNEFYTLLGSDRSIDDFVAVIEKQLDAPHQLPASLEERLPVVGNGSRLAAAIGTEEYRRSEAKLVGGQSFPGSPIKKERHTVVPTLAYSSDETKKILSACKGKGVTVAHAIFALCNIAWSRRAQSTIAPWYVDLLKLRMRSTLICFFCSA